jgi:hypothetical protein
MHTAYFNKGTKNTQSRKDTLFNKWYWERWLSACRKLKLDLCLPPCTNTNSKWIEDLNGRPKTLHLVYKRARNTVETTIGGKDFISRTPSAKQLKESMDEWDYMKLQNKRNSL